MNDSSNEIRYFDFTEEEEVIERWNYPSYAKLWTQITAGEIQNALRRRNPATAIKQLLANLFYAQESQARAIVRRLEFISFLLIVNIIVISMLVYVVWKSGI